MDFWQKLSIDWPCVLGDWLWANLATPLREGLKRLTFRRIVYVAAFLVAAAAFAQICSIDLAFLGAADVALYMEVASAVYFIAARTHMRPVLRATGRGIQTLAHGTRRVLARCAGAMRQRRNANALLRRKSAKGVMPPRDEPDGLAWAI